jgi:two-component system, sensor histidine kinase LadS
MKICTLLIMLLCLSIANQALAQIPILEIKDLDKEKTYFFQPYLQVWADTSNTQTIADIISPKVQQKFIPLDIEKMDITAKSFWLKCQINNLNPDSVRLGLQIGLLERCDIYLLDSEQYAKEPKPTFRRIFKVGYKYDYLTVPPGGSTLYFYITREQDFSMITVKYVLKGMSFFGEDYLSFWTLNKKAIDAFTLLYFGGLILLLCYNLVLFFSLWDKDYLFYLLSLFFWGMFIFGSKDLYTDWVTPAKFVFWLRIVPPILWAVFQLLFVRSLLKLNEWLHWANYLVLTLAYSGVLLLLLLLSASFYPYVLSFYVVFVIISFLALLAIAVVTFLHKKGNYRFYFIGNIALIVGAVIYFLEIMRFIPSTIYSVNAVFLGSLIEMSLFSLALADKINESRRKLVEQELWQVREREALIEEKNEELSEKVKQRTAELQASNATKDKLFSIISHDLRSPMAALKSTIEILDPDIINSAELETIKKELSKQFEATDNTLQNLLLWARSQMGGVSIQKEEIQLKSTIEQIVTLFVLVAENKQITLINDVHEEIKIYADANHLHLIIRNLIANAFKFTRKNGTIIISAVPESEGFITISVRDTGVGMTTEQIGKLFVTDTHFSTRGTNNEHGTGLGLLLCKDFVGKNGGKIRVESEAGKGSTFYFTMPTK